MISYDYLLKKGINTKFNAINILKINQFPDEIIDKSIINYKNRHGDK